jgi:hypothetical protein
MFIFTGKKKQMIKSHLGSILNNIEGFKINQEQFDSFYEPNYEHLTLQEIDAQKFLMFDYKKNEMIFKRGKIDCTGIVFNFIHPNFHDIRVTVFASGRPLKIYNYVLAIPKYTLNDFKGKKSIKQTALKVKSNKDLQRVFKKLKERFECPLVG